MNKAELRALRQRHIDAAMAANTSLSEAGLTDEARSGHEATFKREMDSVDRIDGLLAAAGEDEPEVEKEERDKPPEEKPEKRSAIPGIGGTKVTNEPSPYGPKGTRSFASDVVLAELRGDSAARERLLAASRVEGRANADHNTTIQGAYVVPASIMDAEDLRTDGTPTLDSMGVRELPIGTSEMTWQRVTVGTVADEQAAEGDAFTKTHISTGAISKKPKTIGAYSDVPFQLSERSDPSFDATLVADLKRGVIEKIEERILRAPTGVNFDGLVGTAPGTQVTYTDAAPTVAKFLAQIAAAHAKHIRANKRRATHLYISPERWAWVLGGVDDASRPLVVPSTQAPQNTAGTVNGDGAPLSGAFVGTIHGIPVYVNPGLPIDLGAGTNQDTIVLVTRNDVRIHVETGLHLTVAREVIAHQGEVRFIAHQDALSCIRMPKAITRIDGTGLVMPA